MFRNTPRTAKTEGDDIIYGNIEDMKPTGECQNKDVIKRYEALPLIG